MVLERDWKAMIEAGGNIYLMIKIAGADRRAALAGRCPYRGHDFEQFMATTGALNMGRSLAELVHRMLPPLDRCMTRVSRRSRCGRRSLTDIRRSRHWLELLRPDLFIDGLQRPHEPLLLRCLPDVRAWGGDVHPQADEGWGKRDLPDMRGDAAFSWHLAQRWWRTSSIRRSARRCRLTTA